MTPLARVRASAATDVGDAHRRATPPQRPLRRGSSGDRHDAQELRPALAALGPAAALALGLVAPALPRRSPDGSRRRSTCWRPGDGTWPTSAARSCAGGASSGSVGSRTGRSGGSWRPAALRLAAVVRRRPSASSRSSARSTSATRTNPTSAPAAATARRRWSGRIPCSWVRSSRSWSGAVAMRGLSGRDVLAGGRLAPRSPHAPTASRPNSRRPVRTTALGGTARREPGARRARRALLALARQHGRRTEGHARRGARARSHPRLPGGRPADRPSGPVGARRRRVPALRPMLWSFSEGRLDLLVALAVLPADLRAHSNGVRSRRHRPDGRWRFVAGVGVTLRHLVAFMPGALLARRRARRRATASRVGRVRGLGSLAPRVLAWRPCCSSRSSPTLVAGGRRLPRVADRHDRPGRSLRLARPGRGPGTWVVALFLPVAALVSFARRRGPSCGCGAIRADARRAARAVLCRGSRQRVDSRASVEPARVPRRGRGRRGDADRLRGVVGGPGLGRESFGVASGL